MGTHTPTKWKISRDGFKVLARVDSTDDVIIATVGMSGNASLIVHRVNGWDEQQAKIDELVKACHYTLGHMLESDKVQNDDALFSCISHLMHALTRAKG